MSGPAKYTKNVRVSERHGAGEWMVERITLALLIPLGVWLASTGFTLAGAGYDGVMEWFSHPLNAVLLGVTAIVFFVYAGLAWKVIVEDYIHRPTNKALCLLLVNIVFLALAAVSVFLIVRLALGSAPLPAGIGA